MSGRKVHAKAFRDPYTFCGRLFKDVDYVEFRATDFIDKQPGADRVTCKRCWQEAA